MCDAGIRHTINNVANGTQSIVQHATHASVTYDTDIQTISIPITAAGSIPFMALPHSVKLIGVSTKGQALHPGVISGCNLTTHLQYHITLLS